MKQWYIRFKAGNFENGYYEIGENFDLVKDLCKSEFIKDCKALGFTPITAELTYCEENRIEKGPFYAAYFGIDNFGFW